MNLDRLEELLRRGRTLACVAGVALVVLLAYRVGWRDHRPGDTRFYRASAQLFVDGAELYYQPGHAHGTGYTYPPPFAAASTWMLALPYPAVRVVWLLFAALCAAASVWLAWRYALARPPPPAHKALVLALSLAIVARFGLNDLAHGQSNWLISALLLAGLTGARSEDTLDQSAGGCALALALAIKPTAWLLLPWFLIAQPRRRVVLTCLATLACVLLLPGLRYGPAGYAHQLGDWVQLMSYFADRSAIDPGNTAISSALTRLACGYESGPDQVTPLFGSLPVARALPWARGVSALFALIAGLVLWRRCAHAPEAPAAVLVIGMLTSPVSWKAHLVLLVLPGAVVARDLLSEGGRGRWLTFAAALGCLTLGSKGLTGWRAFDAAGGITLGLLLLFGLLVTILARSSHAALGDPHALQAGGASAEPLAEDARAPGGAAQPEGL